MFIQSLLLALSSSIDSLGIGITYGIKCTKISFIAKVILFGISITISLFSIWFGNIIKDIFPYFITKYIGSIILILMGSFILIESLKKNKISSSKNVDNTFNYINKRPTKKVYSFFIKFLGITIKIIKDPISSDLDNSNSIDYKEALFLGFALSLDSLCIGISGSIINITNYTFPILISFFQLLFLSIGNFVGKKLYNISKLPKNTWSILSGFFLILIGIIKIF